MHNNRGTKGTKTFLEEIKSGQEEVNEENFLFTSERYYLGSILVKSFLNAGMDLFLEVLKTFTNELTIETKALGLLNNIAEVRELHHKLMDNDFICILRWAT